ncbi:uncharacterized protein LOC133795469 [Humulus lupulus]|uniref:uncharacterized protein LOC133795469 n=1 Tax=Humulus lupulus TaxID=3486 RepID=UPI002B412A5F|nr:uncharacterized protein LOC133795469 [Humulus lupulus]
MSLECLTWRGLSRSLDMSFLLVFGSHQKVKSVLELIKDMEGSCGYSAKADDYVMDKREFERVINGYEDVEGEEGDGEEEFVMHMLDDWGESDYKNDEYDYESVDDDEDNEDVDSDEDEEDVFILEREERKQFRDGSDLARYDYDLGDITQVEAEMAEASQPHPDSTTKGATNFVWEKKVKC